MNPFTHAGFDEEREDGLAEAGACSSMASIEFLHPVFGLLTYAIDHGRLSHTRRTNQKKGGMGASGEPVQHGILDVRMEAGCFLLGKAGAMHQSVNVRWWWGFKWA